MTLLLLGIAMTIAWFTCSVVIALVVARGIRLAEREAHDRWSTRFGETLPLG